MANTDDIVDCVASDIDEPYYPWLTLLNTPLLVNWFEPNAKKTTHDPVLGTERASVVADRKTGSAATLAQVLSGQQPEWVENYRHTRSSLHFASARNDMMTAPVLTNASFSLVGIAVVPFIGDSAQHYVCSTPNSGNRCNLRCSGSNDSNQQARFQFGAGASEIVSLSRPVDRPFVFEMSVDRDIDELAAVIDLAEWDEDETVTGTPLPDLTSTNFAVGNFYGASSGSTGIDGDLLALFRLNVSRNDAAYSTWRELFRLFVNDKLKLGL